MAAVRSAPVAGTKVPASPPVTLTSSTTEVTRLRRPDTTPRRTVRRVALVESVEEAGDALSQHLATHCRPNCPRAARNTIDLAREGAVTHFDVPASRLKTQPPTTSNVKSVPRPDQGDRPK
ncbi:hypothetical protein GCM10023191_071080 [Actinoallomurus oryzae]|uniref:Uncharacterized protein n=1 Tax=Actinoallomurus oryzae TaxID=502180 RepID=A0ABP8QTM4_9ACTN